MHTLDQPLQEVLNLQPYHIQAIQTARITTVRDLLMWIPITYVNASSPTQIKNLIPGTHSVVCGSIQKIAVKKIFPKNTPFTEATVRDESGSVRVIWFSGRNATRLHPEDAIRIIGKVHSNKRGIFFANPVISLETEDVLTPLYPRMRGTSPQLIQTWQEQIVSSLPPNLSDPLPPYILKKFNLPSLLRAFQYAHKPPTPAWAAAARKRFAFEEMFIIQLHRLRLRQKLRHTQSLQISSTRELEDIAAILPFPLTSAQNLAAKDILNDMSRPYPMARLLEGDVGSGKTLVAIIASLAALRAGFQVAYLAPTEILARQHFMEFINRLSPFHPSIGLMTSTECKSFPSKLNPMEATHVSHNQLLTWIRNGKLSLLIGTHAVLDKTAQFKNLALAIIDEQHRFGTQQRAKLIQGSVPHLLSMTATPIPRTLALTLYGDLDVSLLDELPPGRKQPVTHIVPPQKRTAAYEFIRKNIQAGGQAFVICPRIEENEEKLDMKSVTDEYKKLSEHVFPDLVISMLHGKLKPKEKEKVIRDFRDKKTHILVSTSVIEVGMDIPNASVMMIEGAERFGLASLHQFRGRVGRAGQQAYCFVFTDSKNKKTHERLQALVKTKNGFTLAEHDLQLRGAGELSGTSQWGISDIGMEALQNLKMVEAARKEAEKLLKEDIELTNYPELRERVKKLEEKGIHLE